MLRYLLPLFGEPAFATRNNDCQTPLDVALENEHELCSEILRTVTSMCFVKQLGISCSILN